MIPHFIHSILACFHWEIDSVGVNHRVSAFPHRDERSEHICIRGFQEHICSQALMLCMAELGSSALLKRVLECLDGQESSVGRIMDPCVELVPKRMMDSCGPSSTVRKWHGWLAFPCV